MTMSTLIKREPVFRRLLLIAIRQADATVLHPARESVSTERVVINSFSVVVIEQPKVGC